MARGSWRSRCPAMATTCNSPWPSAASSEGPGIDQGMSSSADPMHDEQRAGRDGGGRTQRIDGPGVVRPLGQIGRGSESSRPASWATAAKAGRVGLPVGQIGGGRHDRHATDGRVEGGDPEGERPTTPNPSSQTDGTSDLSSSIAALRSSSQPHGLNWPSDVPAPRKQNDNAVQPVSLATRSASSDRSRPRWRPSRARWAGHGR